jgi:hypothetical protein
MADDVFTYMELYTTLGPVEVTADSIEHILQVAIQ